MGFAYSISAFMRLLNSISRSEITTEIKSVFTINDKEKVWKS